MRLGPSLGGSEDIRPPCVLSPSLLLVPQASQRHFLPVQDVDTVYHRQGCRHFSLGDFSHLGSRCVACQDWEGRKIP